MCTAQKSSSSTDLRDVNTIPTEEKQQNVFQGIKIIYDPCY